MTLCFQTETLNLMCSSSHALIKYFRLTPSLRPHYYLEFVFVPNIKLVGIVRICTVLLVQKI